MHDLHCRRSARRVLHTPLLVVVTLAPGCAAPLTGASALVASSRQQEQAVESHAAAADSAVPDPHQIALRKAAAETAPSPDEALAGVLEQLEEIRAIDPAAHGELMAELKQVRPADYPIVVDAFRSALAFREQLAARQNEVDSAAAGDQPPTPLVMRSSGRQPRTQSAEPPRVVRSVSAEAPVRPKQDRSPDSRESRDAARSARPLTPLDSLSDSAEVAAAALATDEPTARVLAASGSHPAAEIAPAGDWRSQLNSTIADLQQNIAAEPSTVAELHDHMRLRTLQLLAGAEDEAYRPIPGASPAQQDYWAKQLFAMAAYLRTSPLDDKQRASAALASLDEARAKLSELATLQIRNLSFVDSVDGFGAYSPRKRAAFRPGQKATVYAEIDNFASTSTEAGYQTTLGTSYQVLDSTGRRIDGKQFPDVEDVCRNRRRDFHMQYQFSLPAKIDPGAYELELTITDHNSGKIAQATIPFEIAGQPQ